MVFRVEPLDTGRHHRSEFCCGEPRLDSYLQKQASQDLKKRIATVFVLVDAPGTEVLGYYTLSAYTINIAALESRFAKRLPRYPTLPAPLLGRLAVDNLHKGQRLGELLLIDACRKTLEVSKQIASLALIVEALNEQSRSFYLKYGFIPFNQEPMKLYLPMKSIESLF